MPTQFNTKSPTIKRILREASELSTSPTTDYHATPLETNLFEWHFTLRGPPSSPYAAGLYHGRIILPPTYPLRPPSFRFLTPSGRFETNREICLSISGHHEETWQPAWGIRTALVALRSFMAQEAKGQVGGLECGDGARRRFAAESAAWRCAGCGGRSNEEVMAEVERRVTEVGEQCKGEQPMAVESVPPELRLGYREDIEGPKSGEEGGAATAGNSVDQTAAANDAPPHREHDQQPTATTSSAPLSSSQVPQSPVPPTTTQPRPTPTIAHRPNPQAQTLRPQSNDGVPAWIDKAIGGVAACLFIMILKKVLQL